MDKAIIKEKKLEGIIGVLFLLPAIRGVICFLVYLITDELTSLTDGWGFYGRPSSDALSIFFGLMAIAGAYMIKNSFRYFFIKKEKSDSKKEGIKTEV